VQLHYVEAGEGPLIVLLHGFPEFWYGWRRQIQPLAQRASASSYQTCAATTCHRRPDDVAAYDTDKLAADIRDLIHERGAQSAFLVGHDWGGTAAWATAMITPRGRGPAGHPQRGPPAEALAGTAPPRPAPQVLVLLSSSPSRTCPKPSCMPTTGTSSGTSWTTPAGLHAGGDRPLHRGVVAARSGHRDDQLLPVLGAAVAEESRSSAPAIKAPTLVIWASKIISLARN